MASTRKSTKHKRAYKRSKLAQARSKKSRARQRKLAREGSITL